MTKVAINWFSQFPKDSEFIVLELNNGDKVYRENKSGLLLIPPDTKVEKKSRAALIYEEIIQLREKLKKYESQFKSAYLKLQLSDEEYDRYQNSCDSIKDEILKLKMQIKRYENLL